MLLTNQNKKKQTKYLNVIPPRINQLIKQVLLTFITKPKFQQLIPEDTYIQATLL